MRGKKARFAVPVTGIYTVEDNLVVPVESARLQGAELIEPHGIGHPGYAAFTPRARLGHCDTVAGYPSMRAQPR